MKKALRPVSFLAALLTLLTVFASTGAADPPSVHDTVYFGSFPQTADGNAEPLKWLVLEVRDDKALIITEKVIDAMDFAPGAPAYWENSVLRVWMNGPFVSAAFTEEEQELLIPTEIRDEDESMNPTVTTDIFFALSREEAERYFPSDADRRAAPTPYALEKRIHTADGACWWWLRSKANTYNVFRRSICHVETDGSVYLPGAGACRDGKENIGARPAGWVRLSVLNGSAEAEGGGAAHAEVSSPAEEGPAGEQPADAVSPAFAIGYGAGVLLSQGYSPDMSALLDLEKTGAAIDSGAVSLSAEPFLITVRCEKDPARTERIDIRMAYVDEKSADAMAVLFCGYLMKTAGFSEDRAVGIVMDLLNGDLTSEKGAVLTEGGYEISLQMDITADYPIRFSLVFPSEAEDASADRESHPILFRGMPYGVSYTDFCARMEADGLKSSGTGTTVTSWEVYYKSGDLENEEKLEKGGFKYTAKSIPPDFQVAGFGVKSLTAIFLKAFDEDSVYDDMGRATLLKATYTFSVTDVRASYDILKEKLSGLYGGGEEKSGSTHWVSTGGNYTEYVMYTVWYGDDHTGVILVRHYEIYDDGNRPKSDTLWLCYGASDSVQKIRDLRDAVAREEMEISSDMDNVDGL